MAIDRTKEFISLAASYGGDVSSHGTSSSAAASKLPFNPVALHGANAKESASAFTRAAASASSDLHMTSMKIAKLTKLVRRRGIFEGDGGTSSSEIDALTASIKADVTRLNGTLDALQSFVDSRKAEAARVGAQPGQPLAAPPPIAGTSAAAAGGASADVTNTVQGLEHSNAVLAGLKSQLLGFGSSLKEVVTLRSEAIKQASQRRAHFGSGPARDLGRPLAMPTSPATPGMTHAGHAGHAGTGAAGMGAVASPAQPSHRHARQSVGDSAGAAAGYGAGGAGGAGTGSADFTSVAIGTPSAGGSSGHAGGPGAGPSSTAARRAAMYGGSGEIGSSLSAGAAALRHGPGHGAVGAFGSGSPEPHGSNRASSTAAVSAASAFGMVDQTQLQVDGESAYLSARAQDVAAIESSIHELAGLFGRLAQLVADQGAQVDRIDASMDEAADRMEAGEAELRRNLERTSSTRGLAVKVVGVLVAFAVGFSVFVV